MLLSILLYGLSTLLCKLAAIYLSKETRIEILVNSEHSEKYLILTQIRRGRMYLVRLELNEVIRVMFVPQPN